MGSGWRTLLACAVPALVITLSWLQLEEPARLGQALAIAALALVPALLPAGRARIAAAVAASLGAGWAIYGAQPWELLPFRDERVLGRSVATAAQGFTDFYRVLLPFEPHESVEMHSLVLTAIFGFTLAVALVARRHPLGAAAVAVGAAGWPATLLTGRPVLYGALALGAALWIPLVQRAGSIRGLAVGTAAAALVVSGAAWASSATTVARGAALEWESWELRGGSDRIADVSFAWDSNYDGIRFPAQKTVVFTVEGPERATYWRASTLNLFSDEHWFEHLLWLRRVDSGSMTRLSASALVPPSQRRNWNEPGSGKAGGPADLLEQKVEVRALVDDHLIAAGTPFAVDARGLGTVFQLSGNVLRAQTTVPAGTSYRVWSFVPDPTRAELAASPGRYPAAAARYLEVDGRVFPAFGAAGRDLLVDEFFADPSYESFRRYRPMYDVAERVTRQADTPYETVLALESWFRYRGGFRYDESPPRLRSSPLVGFVTRTKAGYCQQFAGAMAAMLRMLGIPSRVAVGFTSGRREDGRWVVTDHEAHAWVEVWFAGIGWIPFDPTPGRGTFAADYSFASESDDAVAALRRGELGGSGTGARQIGPRDPADRLVPDPSNPDRPPSLVGVALLVGSLWVLGVGLLKALLGRVRYLTRDPRRLASASRRELEGFLRDQGVALEPGATLQTLQSALRRELGVDARGFTAATARARYGPPAHAVESAAVARRELRRVLRRARRELSLPARARGFVSLRSLRKGHAV